MVIDKKRACYNPYPMINKEFSEILNGFRRTIWLLEKPEKTALIFASVLMLITGLYSLCATEDANILWFYTR